MMSEKYKGTPMAQLEIEESDPFIITPDGKKVKANAAAAVSSKRQFVSKLFTFILMLCLGSYLLMLQIIAVVHNEAYETTSDLKKSWHSSSFGGVNNIAHPGGAKAAFAGEGLAFDDIKIPVSSVPFAVRSLNRENIINQWGHYVHDEFRSPYASHLYDQTQEFLDEQQEKYSAKMKAVREEWGTWDMEDKCSDEACFDEVDFSKIDYRDMSNDQLSSGTWQMDEAYVGQFLGEAKKLVTRVTNGVLAEYGSPHKKPDGTMLSDAEMQEREENWKISILEVGDVTVPVKGVAALSRVAFDGLVRKLLHAMITNDEFYVVLGGHSAAAGHGNDFQQNRMITFHHLMEPVFDKLGVRLLSRNMAQGGVGTLHSSFAGSNIYGEADIIEWDSAMTEKTPSSIDFYNKQAILSGERVPLILHPTAAFQYKLNEETNGTAWLGYYMADVSMLPETVDDVQAKTLPWAARYLNGKGPDNAHKYNAVCWEPRKDVTPAAKQDAKPGSQVGWHPGNITHKFEGRKLALIVLKALSAAIDTWEKGIESDGFPLVESYWHVGEKYKTIRNNLKTYKGAEVSVCETNMWSPRLCKVGMLGYGMWQPQVNTEYNLLNIIQPALNGYKPSIDEELHYTGFDLLPLNQAVPDGEVDAHAIAIATSKDPPDLDHTWTEDDEEATNSTEDEAKVSPVGRRWLGEASKVGIIAGRAKIKSFFQKDSSRSSSSLSFPDQELSIRKRELFSNVVVPGRGWKAEGWRLDPGFCDGSAMSTCNRNKGSKCLIMGHNDNHMSVQGNGYSGWLVLYLPKVKEGLIMARMEWWCGGIKAPKPNAFTADWTDIDTGKTLDTSPYNITEGNRRLGKELIPDDLEMDVAINGKITKVWKSEEWVKYTAEPSKNCAVWPLLDDAAMAKKNMDEGKDGEPVEVAIRYRSKSVPLGFNFCFSHIYYA